MSEILNTVDQVRAGAKRLEWLLKLADQLEKVGSLEQAEVEARRKLESTKGELVAMQKRSEDLGRMIVEEQAKSSERVAAAAREADSIIREAKAAAEREAAEAQSEGQRIRAAAEDEAKRIRAQAAQVKKAADDAQASARSALESANELLAKRRAELADLDAKIEQARQQARRIIGS